MADIGSEPRHRIVQILYGDTTGLRLFPEWRVMQVLESDDANDTPLESLMARQLRAAKACGDNDAALTALLNDTVLQLQDICRDLQSVQAYFSLSDAAGQAHLMLDPAKRSAVL